MDHERRVAYLTTGDGAETAAGYDMLVLAPAALELAQIGMEFARHTAGKPGRFLAYSN